MISDGTIVQKTVSMQVTRDESLYSCVSAGSGSDSPARERLPGGLVGQPVSEWDGVASDVEEGIVAHQYSRRFKQAGCLSAI